MTEYLSAARIEKTCTRGVETGPIRSSLKTQKVFSPAHSAVHLRQESRLKSVAERESMMFRFGG